MWWDVTTFDRYIKANIVPRRLRWDEPPNDGLIDQESTDEWLRFFNEKGIELLHLLLKRKQKKIRKIDKITELEIQLETHKDTVEFTKT